MQVKETGMLADETGKKTSNYNQVLRIKVTEKMFEQNHPEQGCV